MSDLNPKDLRNLQNTLFDILEVFDGFCKSNNIEYFLDSGTALGAKRHEGFIPWDDDIDIGMFREDYDRFLSLAESFPAGYSVHTFSNTQGYAAMFAKVFKEGTVFATRETLDAGCEQCIFIDIFPYDELSSDNVERKNQLKTAAKWQRFSYLYHSSHVTIPQRGIIGFLVRIVCCVAHAILRFVVKREKLETNFEKAREFKSAPSGDYIALAYPYTNPLRKTDIVPTADLQFGNKKYPCPRNIEKYLVSLYGETWTELPPEENRHAHAPLKLVF